MASLAASAHYRFSRDGTLAYVRSTGSRSRTLVWVDREGNAEAIAVPVDPRISPDGTRIAMSDSGEDGDIWIWDFARGTSTRFTFYPARERVPVWSPDGVGLEFTFTKEE